MRFVLPCLSLLLIAALAGCGVKNSTENKNSEAESCVPQSSEKSSNIDFKNSITEGVIESTDNTEIKGSGIKKSYSFKDAIRDGCVVAIFKVDGDSEVYNISKLDSMIDDAKSGKKGSVRLIKYVIDENKIWINRLEDIKYDGKLYYDTGYDTYGDAGFGTNTFNRLVKSTPQGGARYEELRPNDKAGSGATLLSFSAGSIKN